VAGLAAAFGSGAMTNTIADIETADVILITGSNTTENHPVLSSFVKRAKKFRGAKVIVVDPRRIKMTEFADYWLRPNLGTDVAWINGLMHVVLSEEMHDQGLHRRPHRRVRRAQKDRREVSRLNLSRASRAFQQATDRRGPALCRRQGGQYPLLHGHHPAYLRYG
jgi:predicted molibdopterin-dependent oxidoreductase YjgC